MRIDNTLGPEDIELVSARQRHQQMAWRDAPEKGYEVSFAGDGFTVFPEVFPPRSDTKLLLSKLKVPANSAVLDVGTGSGVLAIVACKLGARRCVAVDISAAAVLNARANAERHEVSARMDVRLSDGLEALRPNEVFDVVIANLPGRAATASDHVEAAQWDTGFRTHCHFFERVCAHLAPAGYVIMTKANYPEINDALAMAEKNHLVSRVLAKRLQKGDDPRTYYVLSFTRDQERG